MTDSTKQATGTDTAATGTDDAAHERGFILVTFGLLLIPIVVFTALAVDVSSWYSRATELQRAADAASLAGVVWMPDLTKSSSDATPVLQKNGVVDGVNNMTVSMGIGKTGVTSFEVCVTDNKVKQFFGVVFASPTKMKRCATAQYNAPLQLGSPLNYFGGNHEQLIKYKPGPVPGNAYVAAPPRSAFTGSNLYCRIRSGTTTLGWWWRSGTGTGVDPATYRWYPASMWSSPSPVPPDCGAGASVPAEPDFMQGNTRCNVAPSGRWYKSGSVWYYQQSGQQSGRPDCTYNGYNDSPIPEEKSPNFWAAVEGYGNSHANGDAFSTSGTEYRDTGYWYSVDIPDSGVNGGVVSIQAWDGTTNCELTCRTPMGDDGGPSTRFRVYRAGPLKFDMSAITPATCTTGSADSGYVTNNTNWNLKWRVLCQVTASPGQRYYIQVQSSDSNSSTKTGGGYNGYAMRAVAGSFSAACLDRMPDGDVDCYGTGVQPRLSAYGDMEMYNGIVSGMPTQFYLADVTPDYAGKTLAIDLFDPGDGSGNSWVTVVAPSTGDVKGTPVPSSQCDVQYRAYGTNTWNNVTLSSGPGGAYAGTCTVQTTTSGSNAFQDRWLRFKIELPTNYGPSGTASWTKCDPDTPDPVHNAGSCWWQIKYYTTNNLSDYTTWSARIIGDPVRLTN